MNGKYSGVVVDMSRGVLMNDEYAPDTLYFCVWNDGALYSETDLIVQAITTFMYCLNNYGTGINL
jgi:hypothetical protein